MGKNLRDLKSGARVVVTFEGDRATLSNTPQNSRVDITNSSKS